MAYKRLFTSVCQDSLPFLQAIFTIAVVLRLLPCACANVEVRYDNPWNVPFDSLIAPGIAVDTLRYIAEEWWECEARITEHTRRYTHSLYLADAVLATPRGVQVSDFLTAARNSSLWNVSVFADHASFPTLALQGVEGNLSQHGIDFRVSELAAAEQATAPLNATRVLHVKIRVTNAVLRSLPHIDLAIGFASVHHEEGWGKMFDVASSVKIRIYPGVFDAQHVSALIMMEQVTGIVSEASAQVAIYADTRHPTPSLVPPLAALSLTLAVSPGVRKFSIDPLTSYFLVSPAAENETHVNYTLSNVAWSHACDVASGPTSAGEGDGGTAQPAPPHSCWVSHTTPVSNATSPAALFCQENSFLFTNHTTESMDPIVVLVEWPLTYTPAFTQPGSRLHLHVPLTAETDSGIRLISSLDLTTPLSPAGALHKCEGVVLPVRRDDMQRVVQHIYIGALLDELSTPHGAPTPTAMSYTVTELQRFALLDGMLTLAFLGVDEFFGAQGEFRHVHAVDVRVVRVTDEVTYNKVQALVDLGLAFTVHATTREMTLSRDVMSLCSSVEPLCAIDAPVKAGALDASAFRLRGGGGAEAASEDAAAVAWLTSRMPARATRDVANDAANALVFKAVDTLQPNAEQRAVYFIDASAPLAAQSATQRTIVMASYIVSERQ